jgi:hypothetical protein
MLEYKNDDQVLGFTQWCLLNNISIRTGRRIINGPDAPVVLQISDRKIGVTVGANRAWQERRTRARRGAS